MTRVDKAHLGPPDSVPETRCGLQSRPGSPGLGRRRGATRPTVLELCAGAGGQALGFEKAGFDHVALIDSDSHACATLRMNRPYWNVVEADLNRLDTSYWAGVAVVAAGLPCPPFSVAGKQLGREDYRDLFPAMLRVVKTTQPRVVVVENVRGLLMSRFDIYRSVVSRELEAMGYRVAWRLLDAHDFGAPQRRTRSFMVATARTRGTAEFEWPQPSGPGPSVGEVLREQMAENGWAMAAQWADAAARPAPTLVGGSRRHGGPDLGPTRTRAAWAALGVDGLGIANTAPAQDYEGRPRLTVRMAARLQSFPHDWHLVGSKTQTYRQVGNALSVDLAWAIARSVRRFLESK